jgi:MFS superfamily sulfate permease-like transporter
MKRTRSFPERLETALIIGLCLGIALIAQRYSVAVYRAGLVILVVGTLLQIAVGNLRKDAGVADSLKFIAKILFVIGAVFGIGILLVPTFAQLGR